MLAKYFKNTLFAISIAAVCTLLFFPSTSCTKTNVEYRDTVIIRHDSIIKKYDVATWLQKKWTLNNDEYDLYNNGAFVSETEHNYNGLGYYIQYNTNGTTTVTDAGGISTGTWQLVSDNYLAFDKNTANERYFYILSISETNMILRGPFNKNNGVFSNFLTTAYYKNP